MNTQELQQMFIERYHKAEACTAELKALKAAINNPVHFARVLLSNHGWCMSEGIYSASELLMFEPEILHKAGLALPQYTPVDFERTTSIGGLDWMPLNEGTTIESLNGDLIDFDTAVATKFEKRRMVTNIEWRLLAAAPSQWGCYKESFGRVFHGADNNLFLLASGYRCYNNGAQSSQGSWGHYWSSSVGDSNRDYGWYCYFHGGGVYPDYGSLRGHGFAVRCVVN